MIVTEAHYLKYKKSITKKDNCVPKVSERSFLFHLSNRILKGSNRIMNYSNMIIYDSTW